jgi:hypothetical protein
MQWSGLEITTVTLVNAWKGWTSDEGVRDAWLGVAIKSISARVEQALRRPLLSEARTEHFTIAKNDDQVFRLLGTPVNSSATFEVWSDSDRDFTSDTKIDATDYHVDDNTGLSVVAEAYLDRGFKVIKVSYTGGMATEGTGFRTAYPDIAEAVNMQVAFDYEGRNRLGQVSNTGPDGSISVYDNSPDDIGPGGFLETLKEAIRRHRRRDYTFR